ncbi:MAG: GatB/YqeY domain-containing protein [Patescibacteria group bacterium]
MTLQEKIEGDFLEAYKSKNEAGTSVLRMLKAALVNKKIEKKMAKEDFLPDEETLSVIKAEVKKRQDSIESYRQGNRSDLADKEEGEIKILTGYLPEQLSNDQVLALVMEAVSEAGAKGPSDFGKVMAAVMKKTKGQADGQSVSSLVKEILSQQ